MTRKSRCLAGEPKHFIFAMVFIIKSSLTCSSSWKKLFSGVFLDDFCLFLVIFAQKISGTVKNGIIRCSVITLSVYLTKLFFYYEDFYSYNRKWCFLDDFCLFLVICAQKFSGAIKNAKIRCSVITSSVYLTKLFF